MPANRVAYSARPAIHILAREQNKKRKSAEKIHPRVVAPPPPSAARRSDAGSAYRERPTTMKFTASDGTVFESRAEWREVRAAAADEWDGPFAQLAAAARAALTPSPLPVPGLPPRHTAVRDAPLQL